MAMEFERMQEWQEKPHDPEFDFGTVFFHQNTDPTTGVTRLWEKTADSDWGYKQITDSLPGGYPHRNWLLPDENGTPSYSIYEGTRTLHFDYMRTGGLNAHLYINQEDFRLIVLDYDDEGSLKKIKLFYQEKPTEIDSPAENVDIANQIRYIAQIFKFEAGEIPQLGRTFLDDNPNIEASDITIHDQLATGLFNMNLEMSKSRKRAFGWTEQQLHDVLDGAVRFPDEVVRTIDEIINENHLTFGEGLQLLYFLSRPVTLTIPDDYITLDEAEKKDLLHRNFLERVAKVYNDVKVYDAKRHAASFDVEFTRIEESAGLFKVKIDSHVEIIKIGDTMRFEEHEYALEIDSNNQYVVTTRNILKADGNLKIKFPPEIPLEQMKQLVSTEERTGWEEVLPLFQTSISREAA